LDAARQELEWQGDEVEERGGEDFPYGQFWVQEAGDRGEAIQGDPFI
jgi:hypothetical protein